MLVWEMVGNAHNDGVMMLFGLAGVWLFVTARDRLGTRPTAGEPPRTLGGRVPRPSLFEEVRPEADLLVLLAVAAGALVKVPVALIGPGLFIGLWHRARARAIEAALLGLLLAVVVYRPFWEGVQTLTALRRSDLFTASLGSVLRLSLEPSLGLADATTAARTVSLAAFGAVAVVALWLVARAQSDQDVLRSAYVMLLGALLLATTWFQAWYVVWPLSLGAALADPRRHVEVALLSLGGLLQYFVFIYLWVMGVFPPFENLGVQAAAYLAIIGPLLVGLAARAVNHAGAFKPRPRWVPSGE
jgi:hypothetical protein